MSTGAGSDQVMASGGREAPARAPVGGVTNALQQHKRRKHVGPTEQGAVWALQRRDPSRGRGRTVDHWKGRSGDPRAGRLSSVPLLAGRLPWAPEDGLRDM